MTVESTTSLGNLFLCLTTLTLKKFLPYVQPKYILFQFKSITPCPITTGLGIKSLSIFLISPLYIPKGHNKVSTEPSLLLYAFPSPLALFNPNFQPPLPPLFLPLLLPSQHYLQVPTSQGHG